MAKSKSHKYRSGSKNHNSHNIQNNADPVQPVRQIPDVPSGSPKKSIALRIFVLVVAALMLIGAIMIPFMSLFAN